MPRTLTGDVTTEVQKTGGGANTIRPVALVHLAFDSGSVRLWNGVGDLVWSGDTFTGSGMLGGISLIEESASLKATGVVLTLSGIDSSIIAIALGEHYQGRQAQIWLGHLDSNHALIADPVLMFQGRMDLMQLTDHGATATVSVTVESRAIDLERANKIRYYTDQDQQAEFSGDKFFEFVPEMQEKVIVWGRAIVGGPTQDGNVGTSPAVAGPIPSTPDSGIADPNSGSQNFDINTGLPVEGGTPGPDVGELI